MTEREYVLHMQHAERHLTAVMMADSDRDWCQVLRHLREAVADLAWSMTYAEQECLKRVEVDG